MCELTTIIDSYRFKTSVLHGHGYNPPVHGSGLDRQPEIHNSASTPHYNNTSKSVKLKIKKNLTAIQMQTVYSFEDEDVSPQSGHLVPI